MSSSSIVPCTAENRRCDAALLSMLLFRLGRRPTPLGRFFFKLDPGLELGRTCRSSPLGLRWPSNLRGAWPLTCTGESSSKCADRLLARETVPADRIALGGVCALPREPRDPLPLVPLPTDRSACAVGGSDRNAGNTSTPNNNRSIHNRSICACVHVNTVVAACERFRRRLHTCASVGRTCDEADDIMVGQER